MARTPEERAFRTWKRYVESIPTAVARFAASENRPSPIAIVKYRIGMERHARILERAAAAYTPGKR